MDGDSVIDSDGARLYLDETAARVMRDRMLDAKTDATGGVLLSIEDIH